MLAAILSGALATRAADRWGRPRESFVNWEDAHVHPLELTPDGSLLLAVNTAADSLLVFSLATGTPVLQATIPVGVSPVSVRARSSTEAWVVNRVSDDVTVVNLTTGQVTGLLPTDDEPADVVFAGTPQRAFVTCAKPSLVDVFNPANLTTAAPSIFLYGKEPRALAVSPDGTQVYVAFFQSGNATTCLTGGKNNPDEVDLVRRPEGPYGGVDVPPNRGTLFVPPINPANPPPPPVSMIVRKNATGQWLDDNNGDWTRFVSGDLSYLGGAPGGRVTGWDLPDRDVAVINASSLAVTYQTRLMNMLMAMAVRPSTGEVTVVGTDAMNQIRWEPNLQGVFLRVNLARFLPGGVNTISDLNPHLNYTVPNVPAAVRAQSVGDPRGIAWSADGSQAWITGMGSNNVVVTDGNGVRLGRVNVGEGPTGIVYQASSGRVFVLNKFEASLSVINAAQMAEVARVPFFDPTPPAIKVGRPFLYNTQATSGLGQSSCASCHVDGRTDGLAWDLGNPAGTMTAMVGINDTTGQLDTAMQAPMKGPLLTMTLQDKMNLADMHWAGDRPDLSHFSDAFVTLQGADAPLSLDAIGQLEDFLDTIHISPNPFRNLDNTYRTSLSILGPDNTVIRTGNPVAGAQEFEVDCRSCHPGQSGRGDLIREGGAFGAFLDRRGPMWRNFNERTGFWLKSQTGSTSGFAFQQDGTFDSTQNLTRDDDTMAFMYSFNGRFPYAPAGLNETTDSRDTHAAVGQQLLFTSGTVGPSDATLTLFVQLAEHAEVGLIAKASVGGVMRGYAYVGDGIFQSDRRNERESVAAVRALPGVLFTVVPAGSETRLGIDRDLDGVFDGDAGSPSSAPPVVAADANVALRGTARQSSDWAPAYVAQNALDGSATTDSATASTDATPYWQLTLDDTYAIDQIVLLNHTGLESRLRDVTVYLLDAQGNPIFRSHFLNRNNRLGSPAQLTLDVSQLAGAPLHAKGVRIVRTPDPYGIGQGIPANSPAEANVLSFAEVQVFGAASNNDALLFSATPRPLPGGTFEDVSATGVLINQPAGTPWTFSVGAGISGNGSDWTSQNPPAPEGTQVLVLHNTGGVQQTVKLLAGAYRLSFLAAQRAVLNSGPQTLLVSVDGQPLGTFTPPGSSYMNFQTKAINLAAGWHTISVAGLGLNANGTPATSTTALVDDIQISGVMASPVITPIAAQTSPRGTPVSLQVAASDPSGQPLAFRAEGLPAGLTINGSTGLISGTPNAISSGLSNVTVTVGNYTVSAKVTFTWTLTGNGANAATSGIIIAGDNAYVLYVNGVQLGLGTNWQAAQQYLLDLAPGDLLAVAGANLGSAGGLLAQLQTASQITGTSTRWKVATAAPAGWNAPSFDDSSWVLASDYSNYGYGVWGASVAGMPANTAGHWIWAANPAAPLVYLRYTVPAPATGQTVPLINGSFELPIVSAPLYTGAMTAAQKSAFGWTVSGGLPGSGPALFKIGDAWGYPSPPDGSQGASLQMNSTLSQTVTLPHAGTFTLEWLAAARGSQVNPVHVQVDGATVLRWQAASPAWTSFQATFQVAAAGAHTIAFVGLTPTSSDQSVGIDAVSLVAGTGNAAPAGATMSADKEDAATAGETGDLPGTWSTRAVGSAESTADDASFAGGAYHVRGTGQGLGGSSDQSRFVWRQFAGDGELVARIAANPSGVPAGVMMRETLEPGARFAFMGASAGEWIFRSRAEIGAGASARRLIKDSAPANWVRLVRRGDIFAGFESTDGHAWSQFSLAKIVMDRVIAVGLTLDGRSDLPATFDHVRARSSDFPAPWVGADIGATDAIEFDRYRQGSFEVNGAGSGFGGRSDQGRFVAQPWHGDGQIVAQVAGSGVAAGLMFREGPAPGARYVALTLEPMGGLSIQSREAVGTESTVAAVSNVAGPWLRLTRKGDVFTADTSADGVTWTRGAAVTLPLDEKLSVGLSVSGSADGAVRRASFAGVQTIGGAAVSRQAK